jgi:carboxymethylenebutenolidase
VSGETIAIVADDGVAFDCYLALPAGGGRAPAIVMSSGMYGVTSDMIEMCDWWAAQGFCVAAPEQWARGDAGPLGRADSERAWARIRDPGAFASAKKDLDATLRHMRAHPRCTGRTAILGFCFGGPFAVVGVVELGCDAGGSYHGGGFEHQIENLKKAAKPVQIHWGDKDFSLTPELLAQVRAAAAHNPDCEIFIYPGVEHGYTGPSSSAWNQPARDLSWQRTLPMLNKLKEPRARAAE